MGSRLSDWWNRKLSLAAYLRFSTLDEAKACRDANERMGYPSMIELAHRSEAIGLPETFSGETHGHGFWRAGVEK